MGNVTILSKPWNDIPVNNLVFFYYAIDSYNRGKTKYAVVLQRQNFERNSRDAQKFLEKHFKNIEERKWFEDEWKSRGGKLYRIKQAFELPAALDFRKLLCDTGRFGRGPSQSNALHIETKSGESLMKILQDSFDSLNL